MQFDDRFGVDDAKAAADHRARTLVAQALHPDPAAGTPGDRTVAGGPVPVSRAEQGPVREEAAQGDAAHRQTGARREAEAALAQRLLLPDDTRLEIQVDTEREEVHFLIRDRATGRLLREVPKAEQQSVLDRLREFLGALVDRAV
jgi:uncharacterized FlaG/YvyC family protein